MINKEFDEKVFAVNQYDMERGYWINKLSGLERSVFPSDALTIDSNVRQIDEKTFKFSLSLYRRLMEIINNSDSRLHIAMVTGLSILLYKYTGSNDIIIGTPIAKQDVEGEFINTILPLRIQIDGDLTVKEFLLKVKQTVIEAGDNQNYPIETLPYELSLSMVEGEFPLFDTAIMLQNIQDKQYLKHINLNMLFSFLRTEESLEGIVEYNTSIFKKETIERVVNHFLYVVHEAFFNVNLKLVDISLLTEEEKKVLVIDFNKTTVDYPGDKMIHQLFEEQVERTPDNIAVESKDELYTYKELNEKANRLARVLREKGIVNDTVTAIILEHSGSVPLAFMAVLKAGGAYLPIGNEYPTDRIDYILKDSRAKLVLIHKSQIEGKNIECPVCFVDDGANYSNDTGNLYPVNNVNSLAYIIYTSGTTGQPKGVMIEHKGIVNYIWWAARQYVGDERLNFALYTSISFDLTVTSIFTPLITGNGIIAYGEIDKQLYIEDVIDDNRVGIVKLTPSHLKLIRSKKVKDSSIKRLIVGGEELETQLAKDIYNNFNHKIEIYNEYGPTETVVGSMIYRFDPVNDSRHTIPIGRPIANTRIYVLNSYLQPVPVGVEGGIYIGGDGLARGYLFNPKLSEEKFVMDPFIPGQKMYKTGDLAVRLPDGNIEYKGRIDHQVKIRGYRVETGEIEVKITDFLKRIHPGIENAGCIIKDVKDEIGEKTLCAYILSDKGFDVSELKTELFRELPDYMIPMYYTRIDRIPLTSSGKVDRKALPKPELTLEEEYVAPRNNVEEKLTEVWSEVLGLKKEKIGIDANFFEVGGHSLRATFLAAAVQKHFNVKLPLVKIFESPTIRGQAELIKESTQELFTSIESSEEKEYYELSSAQRRLYILQQLDLNSTAYNVPMMVEIEEEIKREKLEETFRKLSYRHESLKTFFTIIEDTPMQKIDHGLEFKIEYYVNPDIKPRDIISDFVRSFDLTREPLMRVGLMKIGFTSYILMVDLHHIITDGISQNILMTDFISLYNDIQLPALRFQYRDYSEWQRSQETQSTLLKQEKYWVNEFAGEITVLNIPTDFSRPLVQSVEGNSIRFEIDNEETTALYEIARLENVTLFMILLSIYNIFLSKICSQDDIVVGIPIAGRRHADLEKIVGMFVNTLALRTYPRGEKTYKEFLNEIRMKTIDAFENQDYQFEDLVDKVEIQRDMSRNPIFDTLFVMQNMFNPSENLSEKKMGGLKIKPYSHKNKTSKFDLSLGATESERKVYFYIEYCTKLFKEETIVRFIDYFKKIVCTIIDSSEIKISEIEIISEEEKKRILNDFNNTGADYPKNKTIHELFGEQVERTPDNIALVGSSLLAQYEVFQQMTYKEINEKSNSLANELIKKGVESETFVAIKIGRSIDMIIGIMGILKAGGAYLLLEPGLPEERIDYILNDSGARIILTGNDISDIRLMVTKTELMGRNKLEFSPAQETDLAYVIYTSGSTGRPKGVLVQHLGIVNLVNFHRKSFGEVDFLRASQVSSQTFDAAAFEIWPSLLRGATLYIAPDDIRQDSFMIKNWLILNRITASFQSTAIAMQLLEERWTESDSSLKIIWTAGDRLTVYLKYSYPFRLYNLYGPTEDTVWTTWVEVPVEPWNKTYPPIGRPIANHRVYILGTDFGLQPVGVCGELCICGVGISRGYSNNPELTAERFINFTGELLENKNEKEEAIFDVRNSKLYRTGDLTRWLPDGNLEFLGRMDHQVKIRGFRIELEEIESRILNIGGIKETVVLVREEVASDKYICAYFVSEREYGISELRDSLSKELPDYMIPSYFIRMEKIPLTTNGKINRKVLPAPELKAGENYTGPRDEIEVKLVKLWLEILGRDDLHRSQLKAVIGIDDNFFELGGHSLKATILVSKIHQVFDVKAPLGEIFKAPRIRDMANYIKEKKKERYVSIESTEAKEYYLLSSAQKRLYILQQMNPNSTAYNMPEIIPLSLSSDLGKIKESLRRLIKRHESLRTSFHMINDRPVQVVHEEVEFEVSLHDSQDSFDSQDFIKRFIMPFDLAKAPLIRVGLIKGEVKHEILIVDMSHIISDGISHEILVKDFLALYKGEELLPLGVQYKDFSEWQNGEKEKEDLRRQEEYWLKAFEGEIPILGLPIDYSRPVTQSFEGNRVNFEIKDEETRTLKTMALSEGYTLFMVLIGIYNILLSKLSGQEDIVIGAPISGRRHADLEKIIGMFVNTLPLRNYPAGDRSFREFLGEVKERTLMVFENQEYPFEELVDKLSLRRDIVRNPLFDVMFDLQNMNTGSAGKEKKREDKPTGLVEADSKEEYGDIFQTVKFDLTLTAMEIGRGFFLSFQYCTKLFKKETIERFIIYFKKIVSIVMREPGIKLSEIEIISEEERKKILYEFNDTEADYPRNKTIHRLFEEQVEITPDNIAVVGSLLHETDRLSINLTYKELNEKSNLLAYVLQSKGVEFDSIVGIMMERSIEMMIGILGIFKAGGAYLPISPDYPQERIDYMLKDSGAKLLVTGNDMGEFPNLLTSQLPNFYFSPATTLAYVIYTSGSTGKPKGAMVEHIGMTNHIYAKVNDLHLSENSIVAQNASHTFDISVWQFFASLTQGGKTIIYSNEVVLSTERFISRLTSDQISILEVVPSYLSVLLSSIVEKNITFLPLEYLLVTGEEVKPRLAKHWFEIFPGIKMVNAYGPTEASDDITHHIMDRVPDLESIPIGKPVQNTRIYIVDNNMQLCPIGVKGEIWVSGIGVGRGYLNDMRKTSLAFMVDPFTKEKGVRAYRTGDLGRWFPDGSIEFFGRTDNQVKIHGFRVELGEIENRILKYPGIKEGVVIDRTEENGDKYLCAYIVFDREYEISGLRDMLSKELPDYMIPSYIVQLERLPLNQSGKIDRKALPEPEIKTGNEYTGPRNPIEEKLSELWSEVLGIEKNKIGIDNNFFQLGGHSLKAMILGSKIHKALDVKLPLVELFKSPTIRNLSQYLKAQAQEKHEAILPVEEKEYYPLSSAQKRLYLIQQMDLKNTTYNMSEIYILDEEPDQKRLKKTFMKLIERHESLRTSFVVANGEPVQRVHKNVEFEIEYYDSTLGKPGPKQIIDNFMRAFDLSLAPLLRVGLIKRVENKYMLIVDMSHIVSDGVSHGILVKDFIALYSMDEPPALRLHYKDFSSWQNNFINSSEMKKQEQYWLKEFAGDLPGLDIPMDYCRQETQSFEGDSIQFEISGNETNVLNNWSKRENATLFMVLLAIYTAMLSKLSGQEDIIVGVGTAGRRHVDLEKIIGMFVNTLALRNYPVKEKTFNEFLREVRDRTLQAFENQDYLFEDLVDKVVKKRDLSRNPLFDTVFMLQGVGEAPVNTSLPENSRLNLRTYEYSRYISKFDMSWECMEVNSRLIFLVNYCTKLFKKETIERYINYFKEIVAEVTTNNDIKIKNLLDSFQLLRAQSNDDDMELGF